MPPDPSSFYTTTNLTNSKILLDPPLARPPKPPSNSAATGRLDFTSGLKHLVKNYNFLLLVLLYGASIGVYGAWCSVLDQNLSEFGLGVSQKFAGWLGFVAIISGSFSGIIFSL